MATPKQTKATQALPTRIIDLDAGRREGREPDGFGLRLNGTVHVFPSELPVDTFDPFLTDEFDVVDLIRTVAPMMKRDEEGKARPTLDLILDVLNARPKLHKETIAAVNGAIRNLMGEDQYATFMGTRRSFEDYGRLITALFDVYGVNLGEALASVASFGTDETTPKPTSDESTDSTSETPSQTPTDQSTD